MEDSFVRQLFEFVSLCTLAVSIISFCIASDPHYRLECLDVRCPEKKWVETETFYVRDNSVNPGLLSPTLPSKRSFPNHPITINLEFSMNLKHPKARFGLKLYRMNFESKKKAVHL